MPPLPALPRARGAVVCLIAGLLIALGQVDGLLGELLMPGGGTTSPTRLTGIGHLFASGTVDEWRFLLGGHPGQARTAGWIETYAALDLLVIGAYAVVGLWFRELAGTLVSFVTDGGQVLTWTRSPAWIHAGLAVLATGLVDIAENEVMLVGLGHEGWPAGALPWISRAKWAAVAVAVVFVGSALRGDSQARSAAGASARHTARRWASALYTHRYSVLVVLPLAALGLAKGPDLLDQIPDIQRRWAENHGWGDFVAAAAVTPFVAGAVFLMGRMRSHNHVRRHLGLAPDPHTRPVLWLWWASPAVVLAYAGFSLSFDGHPAWMRVAVFAGVPLAIAVISTVLRRWRHTFVRDPGGGWTVSPVLPTWLSRKAKPTVDAEQVRLAILVGDGLAVVLLILPGLGLVRALTGVVALDGAGNCRAVALLLLGALVTALGWALATWALAWLNAVSGETFDSMASAAPGQILVTDGGILTLVTPGVESRRGWLAPLLLGSATVVIVPMGVWTESIARQLGPLATFLLALLVLAVLIGAAVVTLQKGGAPELFWVRGIRQASAPTTSLLLIAALAGSYFGGGDDVHGLRSLPGGPDDPTSRPRWADVVSTWSSASSCAIRLPGGVFTARPLFVYAAEGGGIRAAMWTTLGLDALRQMETSVEDGAGVRLAGCTQALMSSGASGGAVGLAVADVTAPGQASDPVARMAGPDALSSATVGLILTDAVFAAAGVPIPTRAPSTAAWRWVDRAGHMEIAWESASGGRLMMPFLHRRHDVRSVAPVFSPTMTGALVLNSSSATNGCRALVSQVDLSAGVGSGRAGDCTATGLPAGSFDLVTLTARCRIGLATSTAAMLASRFPYVTPSGALCPAAGGQQLVDGGYLENTGIGTVVDLAPNWMTDVRAHNDAVLADPHSGPLWVPILVYFDNGRGSDLAKLADKHVLEPFVPPKTLLGGTGVLTGTDAQLRRAQAAFATDQLWSLGPEATKTDATATTPTSTAGVDAAVVKAARDAVDAWREEAVVVVYQRTEPSISAPLGWVLSDASRTTLESAMNEQSNLPCWQPGPGLSVLADKGYGTLADVKCLLGQHR